MGSILELANPTAVRGLDAHHHVAWCDVLKPVGRVGKVSPVPDRVSHVTSLDLSFLAWKVRLMTTVVLTF